MNVSRQQAAVNDDAGIGHGAERAHVRTRRLMLETRYG
jgi:hypothetical protein